MNHYNFHKRFRAVYDRALASFNKGAKDAASLLDAADAAFLESIGGSAQAMFDYAEDAASYDGEPDFETALMIEAARRDYFLTIQNGELSKRVLDESTLPAKTETVRGIEWLPRIIPKARAKLHGELPASLMFCCAGDRKFFKEHDIHPAEFLRTVWACEDDTDKLADWVGRRSKAAAAVGA
ncbi:MAG: DUF5069 domain-containing protein [Opitutaceae bacterium]